MNQLHHKEKDVSVLETAFHFNEIWMVIFLHYLTFKLDQFDDIVVYEHTLLDRFNSVELFILAVLSKINFTESAFTEVPGARDITKLIIRDVLDNYL